MRAMIFLAGVCVVALSAPVAAQDAEKRAPATDSQNYTGLNEIVVTATKRETLIYDVPGTISAVSGDTLQRQGGNSLSDITSVVSGLTVGGLGTGALISIRGVSTTVGTAGSAQPNAIYVDGIYNAAGAVLRNRYPDIERVEVLKGPQGTLFGRNATGGAVQVYTRNPEFDLTAKVDVDVGFYTGAGSSAAARHLNPRAFVSGPIIPDLVAVSLAGGYTYSNGYTVDDADGGSTGEFRDTYLRGKLLLQPAENFKIVLGGFQIKSHSIRDAIAYPRKVSVAAPPFVYPNNSALSLFPGTVVATQAWHYAGDENIDPNSNKAFQRQRGVTARADLDLDIGTFTSVAGYTKTQNNFSNNSAGRSTAACRASFVCLNANFFVAVKEFSQELDFASRDFGIFSFIGGLNYYHSKGANSGSLLVLGSPSTPFFPYINIDVRTKSYAAFGELTVKPTDKLSVVLGLRYNHEPHDDRELLSGLRRKKTFNSYTPKISVKYEIADNLNVYGNFSIGRTSGLTGVTNAAAPVRYAPVDEEILNAYEVGMKFNSRDVAGSVSVFYYDYKNKQEAVNNLTAPFTQNTGPVRLYGLDADLSAHITPEFSLSLNASYVPYAKYRDFPDAAPGNGRTYDVTGNRLARAPKLTGNATLAFDSGPFDASVTLAYSSKIFQDVTSFIYQPRYIKVNSSIGYDLSDNVHVGVFGRNLTNRKIITSFQLLQTGAGTLFEAPQEIGVTLGFKY